MAYQYHSQKIVPGDTFLCLPGADAYVADAQARGAIAVQHVTRAEMAKIADDYYKRPSQKLTVLGVTGTNGKTTTINLIAQLLRAAGFNPMMSGTLTGNLTTRESLDLQASMSDAWSSGYTHFVMEVSSHGIDQGRVLEIAFAGKGLTNITQDHLDYHHTLEEYKRVKMEFMRHYPGWAVLPGDYAKETLPENFPLWGEFNRQNAQLAKAMVRRLGISETVVDVALGNAKAPKGRFEAVDTQGLGFSVVVDYAHAPDGIKQVLETARRVMAEKNMSGQLWIVFGCGGDRDKTKRPIMGQLAAELADRVVVTSDNPRTEDPQLIIQEIVSGIPQSAIHNLQFVDRREALRFVVEHAQAGDFIVVAGKGHEDYQIIGKEKFHFDDREELEQAIEIRLGQS